MSKSFFRQFQNEDWIATLMGLLLVVTVIVLPGLIPVFPKELNTVGAWLSILGLLVVDCWFPHWVSGCWVND